MPRDIPVGNGKLLVCFDASYRIRDLYFPHVGQENHLSGAPSMFGVWTDGRFSWVHHGWKIDLDYEPDTLVTRVHLYNPDMKLLLTCRDAVDFHETIYLREVSIENLASRRREIRLFFHHNFNISGNDVGDTAALDPKTDGIVHYKASRYFLVNGRVSEKKGIYEYAVGRKGTGGREGTYRDAEDGSLSGNSVAQGAVDSVISLRLSVEAASKENAWYWMAVGETWENVRRLDTLVRYKSPKNLIRRTHDYWHIWVRKENPGLERMSTSLARLYRRSLLVLRTQIDWQGGILAANDTDVIQFNRDTYSYVWPRDGALVANALDLAGYPIPAQNFYRFIADRIEKEGYLLHKYNPDGSLASSWHPWMNRGQVQLPIQEDETALVLWALWNHFVLYRDIEFIKPLYRPLIKRAADFMCGYRDELTGLPDASYDLWEERRGILSFTVGAVFGGLTAASLFCSIFGETDRADRYQKAAGEIRDAASEFLWCPELNRFCRCVIAGPGGTFETDSACDASLWGLFAFGMYSADDNRIQSTMEALHDALWVDTPVGGTARYEQDDYNRAVDDIPGNPWFICTLWMADYLVEKSGNEPDLQRALDILEWVTDHALPSGVLAEQVHPLTGEPLSVSPLTWSHATFVATCQRFLKRSGKMKVCPQCGRSLQLERRKEDWLERLYAQTCDSIHGRCRY